jgi:intracellular sulfur oxidation DsrE/DsrF family protein
MRAGWILTGLLIVAGCDAAPDDGYPSATGLQPAIEPGLEESRPQLIPDLPSPRQVYDITLHDPEQLTLLLKRLEAVTPSPNAQHQTPQIALVLHGPEVAFFARQNYAEHRELVDLAAKLDAFQVIEVKVCETRMSGLGLSVEDMPAFVEPVPFGPAEVERLTDNGYIKM